MFLCPQSSRGDSELSDKFSGFSLLQAPVLWPRGSVTCVMPQRTECFGGTAGTLCTPAPWSLAWVTRVLPQESPCTMWRVEGEVGKDPARSGRLAAERLCWGRGWAPVPALPWARACEVRGPTRAQRSLQIRHAGPVFALSRTKRVPAQRV